ncbi:hypothetical protein RQP46_009596 [Phenoliferia psychrophenolica]
MPPIAPTPDVDPSLSPSPVPARANPFSPELLIQIVQECAYFERDEPPHPEPDWPPHQQLTNRNAMLSKLALVDRAFQKATYSILYSDLRIAWFAGTVKRLLESFETNPELPLLVRSFEASGSDAKTWKGYRTDAMPEARECYRAAARMSGSVDRLWATAAAEWRAMGHSRWEEQYGDEYGMQELVDLLATFPNLQALEVQGIAQNNLPDDSVVRGGPLLNVTSITTPDACPFLHTSNLASLLVSRSPNLNRLVGTMDVDHGALGDSAAFLPDSLAHLKIYSCSEMSLERLTEILHKVRPKNLDLTVFAAGWAPIIAPHLSSLSSLALHVKFYGDVGGLTFLADSEYFAKALSTSHTLRNLKFEVEVHQIPDELFSSLPLSLSSITVTDTPLFLIILIKTSRRERLGVILDHLRGAKSKPRPLRLAVGSRWSLREEVKEFVDEYAKEGVQLVAV